MACYDAKTSSKSLSRKRNWYFSKLVISLKSAKILNRYTYIGLEFLPIESACLCDTEGFSIATPYGSYGL